MSSALPVHDLHLSSYFVKNKGMDMRRKLSVDSQSNSARKCDGNVPYKVK